MDGTGAISKEQSEEYLFRASCEDELVKPLSVNQEIEKKKVTVEEIVAILKSRNEESLPRIDNIRWKRLKILHKKFLEILNRLMNECIEYAVVFGL